MVAALDNIFGEAKESWLGAIWYGTFHRLEVPHDDLVKFAKEVGLGENWIPKATRPHDAFKQACREWEQQTVEAVAKGKAKIENVIHEYRIMEVPDKPRARDWVRITTHPGAKPSKTALGRFEFDEHDAVVVSVYDEAEKAGLAKSVRETGEQIKARTEVLKKCLIERDVRELARRVLENVNQLKLRDGLYFVPREHAELVEKLEALVEKLQPYHKLAEVSELKSIPYPDTEKLRKLIFVKFEGQTLGEIQAMLEAITPVLKSGAVYPKAAFVQLSRELERIKKAKEQYGTLLENTMATVDVQLEVLQKQLVKLADQLESGDEGKKKEA